jgi:hypothetical protein
MVINYTIVGTDPRDVYSDGTSVWVGNYTSNNFSKITINKDVAKVYSYNYGSNGQWLYDTSLNEVQVGEAFGSYLAVNAAGDRLSVSAPTSASPNNTYGGRVYNYVYQNGKGWQYVFNLTGSVGGGLQRNSTSRGASFGQALALNGIGNRLMIGHANYVAGTFAWAPHWGTGIVYSYDEPLAYRQCNAIAASNSMIVAGGTSIRNPLAYSLDSGQTWTEFVTTDLFGGADASANIWGLNVNTRTYQCNAVAWNGSLWVAGGVGGFGFSVDGLNWLPSLFTGLATVLAVAWNATTWLAGGITPSGVAAQASSSDGITWTLNPVGSSALMQKALTARRSIFNSQPQTNPAIQAGILTPYSKGYEGTVPIPLTIQTFFTPTTNGICMVHFNFITQQRFGYNLTINNIYYINFQIIQKGKIVSVVTNGSTFMPSSLSIVGPVVANYPVTLQWYLTTDSNYNFNSGAVTTFGNYVLVPTS